jgi:hypothetical protein
MRVPRPKQVSEQGSIFATGIRGRERRSDLRTAQTATAGVLDSRIAGHQTSNSASLGRGGLNIRACYPRVAFLRMNGEAFHDDAASITSV